MAAPLPAHTALHADCLRDPWLPSYAEVLRQWLADGGTVRLPLSGVSMEPTIASGVHVVVEGCEPSAIRFADVVVYEDGSGLICHRVLWCRGLPDACELLTKGDRWRLPSTWVPATAVVGRVVATETADGRRRLQTPAERLRARAVAARSWVAVLGCALVQTLRGRRRPTTRAA